MDGITLVTGNAGKARELRGLLGVDLTTAAIDLAEVQSLDVAEVAHDKAAQAWARLRTPVLVDDSALAVAAWNGLPGALVKWFLQTVGNAGILRMAEGLEDRTATATSALGYADDRGVRVFVGTLAGSLSHDERGANGFGYDRIFVPDGHRETFAELSPTARAAISMRQPAARDLRRYLAD